MAFEENVRGKTERLRQRPCHAHCQSGLPVIAALVALLLPPVTTLAGEGQGQKSDNAKVTTSDARKSGAAKDAKTAKGEKTALPRYQMEAGRKLVYEVRIEGTTPDGLEVTSGHSYYTVKSVDAKTGNMTLSNWASLSTRRGGSAGRGFPFGPPRPPFGRMGPPFASSETNYGIAREIVIDPTGNVIKSNGHAYLPMLLGELWELVLDPMPPEGKRRWESSNEVLLVKKDVGVPWRPPFLAGKEVSRSAQQTVKYTLGKADAGIVTIEKKYELVTEEKVGDKPFLQQVGEGQIEFDLARRVPRKVGMEFTITIERQEGRVKIPGSVSARLLDAAEVERLAAQREAAAAAASEAAKPKELGDAALDAALADLKSGEKNKMLNAAHRLANAVPIDSRREEVTSALEPLLTSHESYVPAAAAKALGVWGTEANVPALIAVLDSKYALRKMAAMTALAKLKDPRGAEAVAKQVVPLQTRAAAINALQKMGPIAEGPVLSLLKHEEWTVQVTACQILAAIGTQRSAGPLERLAAASDSASSERLVAIEAKKALEAIGKRGQPSAP